MLSSVAGNVIATAQCRTAAHLSVHQCSIYLVCKSFKHVFFWKKKPTVGISGGRQQVVQTMEKDRLDQDEIWPRSEEAF